MVGVCTLLRNPRSYSVCVRITNTAPVVVTCLFPVPTCPRSYFGPENPRPLLSGSLNSRNHAEVSWSLATLLFGGPRSTIAPPRWGLVPRKFTIKFGIAPPSSRRQSRTGFFLATFVEALCAPSSLAKQFLCIGREWGLAFDVFPRL